MSKNNIHSNLHKIVTVDDKFEPLKIKPEYLPDDINFSGDYNDLTNKPTIPSKTSELTNDSGFITIDDVPEPIPQVQADYAQTNTAALDFIKNKPTLFSGNYNDLTGKPTLGTAASANTTDFATASQGAKADTAVQPGSLATVATSGDFNDLINKPAPFDPGTLATVATTGSYTDLTDKPTIPDKTSDLTNDSGFITIDDVPEPIPQVQSDYAQTNTAALDFIKNKPTLFSGNYNDLTNKPTLGTAASANTTDFATSSQGTKADTAVQPGSLATVATSGDFNDLINKPAPFDPGTLATVATTGSYTDLTDKPTIPTKTSDLTNDSGFITIDDVPAQVPQVQADYAQTDNTQVDFIKNKPTLGTISSQDSNAVTITGGTLSGITLDDVNSLVGADHIHFKVKADEALTKGMPVKIVGFQPGENALRVAKLTQPSDISIGVLHDTLAIGEFGAVVTKGELKNINTSSFAQGDILYPTTDGTGQFTSTKPTTGKYQALAYVLRVQSNNGAILIDAAEPRDIITLPTKTSELTNDSGFITIDDVPEPIPQVQADYAQTDNTQVDFIKNKPTLATVATSGSYNDLIDKPVCEPVSKMDAARPIAYVARGDKIIKLDYTNNIVPVRSKFITGDLEADWLNRTSLTYTPCT